MTDERDQLAELMRMGARRALDFDTTWESELVETVSGLFDIADDPGTVAAIRKYTLLSTTHFAASIIKNPLDPVEPYIDPEIRTQIREQLRKGKPEAILNVYRASQIAAWQAWMKLTFTLTGSKEALEQLLEFSAKQINDYSQRSITMLAYMVDEERIALAQPSVNLRFKTVQAILNRELLEPGQAAAKLDYSIDRSHQAFIVWSRFDDVDSDRLHLAADRIELLGGKRSALRINATASTLWLWTPSAVEIDVSECAPVEAVNISAGTLKSGLEGFIGTHEEALVAQRMQIRSERKCSVVAFTEVRLAHMLLEQPMIGGFLRDTLGRLLDAPSATRDCLRVFLEEGSNAARAASALGLHRNTLNRQLDRAKYLLPQKELNAKNRTSVASALSALSWM
ncbi:MAG: helix-turn-helix domain-containing protein [Pseudomonadota bacterium]